MVVDKFEVAEPRTGALKKRLAEMGVEQGLIITSEIDGNLYLASRNIPGVHSLDVSGIDPVSLVAAEKVVMTVDAVKKLQEWLG